MGIKGHWHYGGHAQCGRGADDRAHVARVLEAIQDQKSTDGAFRGPQHPLRDRRHGQHTLRAVGVSRALQLGLRHRRDRNPPSLSRSHQCPAAGLFAHPRGNQQTVHR